MRREQADDPADVRRAAHEARERCGWTARTGRPAQHREPRGVQRRTGVDTELVGEPLAGAVEHGQGLDLPPSRVQAPGQQGRGGLPQRLGGQQRTQGVELRAGFAEKQSSVGGQFDGRRAQLVEPGGGHVAARKPADVRQRWTAPQRRRLDEQRAGLRGVEAAGRGDERLEPERVDVVRVDGQPVAARNGLDDVGAERPAQPRHECLQRVGGGVRRFGAPQ